MSRHMYLYCIRIDGVHSDFTVLKANKNKIVDMEYELWLTLKIILTLK